MTGKIALLLILVAHFNAYAMEVPQLNVEQSLDDLEMKNAILHSTDEHQAYEKAKQLHEKYNTPETLALKEEAADLALKTPQYKAFDEAIKRHKKLLADRSNKLPSVEVFSSSDLQKADALILEIDELYLIINQQRKANIKKTLEAQRLLIIIQRDVDILEECQKVANTAHFQQYTEAKKYYQQYPTADSQCMVDTCAEGLHNTAAYIMWLWKAKDKIKAYQPIHSSHDLFLTYLAIENSPEYIQYKNAKIDYEEAQKNNATATISFYTKELEACKSNVKATQQFQEWEKALQQIEHIQVPDEKFKKIVTAQKELYDTNTFNDYMDAYAIYEANKTDHTGIRLLQDTYNAVIKTKQYQDLLVTQKKIGSLVDKIKRCDSCTPTQKSARPVIGINYNPKGSEKRFIVSSMS